MQCMLISFGIYLCILICVKVIVGNLFNVCIVVFVGDSSGVVVLGLLIFVLVVSLMGYGNVVEVLVIVGSGWCDGVDMFWGCNVVFGYFGLDLMGDNNGLVWIENFVIEDVMVVFMLGMLDWVDVCDFGVLGNGVVDDCVVFVVVNQVVGGGQIFVL